MNNSVAAKFNDPHHCKLVVLNHVDASPHKTFTEDLLSIVHVFSCRFNGLRR